MSSTAELLSGDHVADRLVELGFERRNSRDGRRALLTLGELRFVIPIGGRMLPPRVVLMVESTLAPVFGDGRLTAIDDHGTESDDRVETVVVLDAVVLVDDGGWYAYLLEEPSIMGFGAGRTDALRDLKEAAALCLGTTTAGIALFTPTVV